MEERYFIDLPAALVDEMLEKTTDISSQLLSMFDSVKKNRTIWRDQLITENLLCREADLPIVEIPTSCGIDGTQAIERLLALDLLVVGAVATEGLTPPSETRFWPDPYHNLYIDIEEHEADTSQILRGLMVGRELELASKAPHDLVFLDGSFTTPLIFFNQSLNGLSTAQQLGVSVELKNNIFNYISLYKGILDSNRSDRYWIAIPKYTTKREIGNKFNWSSNFDDRGILSIILEPGEFTKPILLSSPDSPWHVNSGVIKLPNQDEFEGKIRDIIELIQNIYVTYYRPYSYLPALRIEFNRTVKKNPSQLSTVLSGVKFQCGSAAILEPYPLYMADRMIKHLATSLPTFRQIASQSLAENYDGNISDIFLGLHGYRTESGG